MERKISFSSRFWLDQVEMHGNAFHIVIRTNIAG